jgi:hypothetical protein
MDPSFSAGHAQFIQDNPEVLVEVMRFKAERPSME